MKCLSNLSCFSEYDNHELVYEIKDKDTKLHAYIAIHNTNLGPATGGTRFFFYESKNHAIKDVLKLSKAMTYKCALAGIHYGGGKGVIVGNHKNIKTNALLKKYAEAVNQFKGKFTTGEDVGLTKSDIMVLSKYSEYIHGRKDGVGELGPWAALGVFKAIQASFDFKFGSSDITNRSFAVKGLGKVGSALCCLINKYGGNIIATDIDKNAVRNIQKEIPKIKIVEPSEIYKQEVDVFSPCALGNEFNEKNVNELNCKIICGAGNNQLENEKIGEYFYENDIIYVPDYIANAGGLISIVSEMDNNGYSKEKVEAKINKIFNTTKQILESTRDKKKPTNFIANQLAEKIINENK